MDWLAYKLLVFAWLVLDWLVYKLLVLLLLVLELLVLLWLASKLSHLILRTCAYILVLLLNLKLFLQFNFPLCFSTLRFLFFGRCCINSARNLLGSDVSDTDEAALGKTCKNNGESK